MAKVIHRKKVKVWKDVIFAIFIREIKSKFDDKLGLVWAFLNPLMFVFVLSYGRELLWGPYTHSMPTFMFMLYGMLFIQLFTSTLKSTSSAISRNRALFAFRQVQPISAIIASALLELLVKIVVILLLMLIILFLRLEYQLSNVLLIFAYLGQTWFIAISLGLVLGVSREFVKEIKRAQELLVRPLFFISAVFFSLQDIPTEFWNYLDWNPILHAIELSRSAAYSNYPVLGVSSVYLISFTIITALFSLIVYKLSWKRMLGK